MEEGGMTSSCDDQGGVPIKAGLWMMGRTSMGRDLWEHSRKCGLMGKNMGSGVSQSWVSILVSLTMCPQAHKPLRGSSFLVVKWGQHYQPQKVGRESVRKSLRLAPSTEQAHGSWQLVFLLLLKTASGIETERPMCIWSRLVAENCHTKQGWGWMSWKQGWGQRNYM